MSTKKVLLFVCLYSPEINKILMLHLKYLAKSKEYFNFIKKRYLQQISEKVPKSIIQWSSKSINFMLFKIQKFYTMVDALTVLTIFFFFLMEKNDLKCT